MPPDPFAQRLDLAVCLSPDPAMFPMSCRSMRSLRPRNGEDSEDAGADRSRCISTPKSSRTEKSTRDTASLLVRASLEREREATDGSGCTSPSHYTQAPAHVDVPSVVFFLGTFYRASWGPFAACELTIQILLEGPISYLVTEMPPSREQVPHNWRHRSYRMLRS